MRSTILTALVCVCAATTDAAAQHVQRPTRPYRGLFGGGPTADPTRTRSELTFTGSVLVGYDTWLSPGGTGISPTQEPQSGSALSGEAALGYYYGNGRRSLSIDGRTLTLGYSGIDADPTIGGRVTIAGHSNLGRVARLHLMQDVAYEPTLVLGSTTPDLPIEGSVAAPPAEVTSGYLEQRSWSSNTGVSLGRQWTPRQTTQIDAAYRHSEFLDEFGYDTRSLRADLSHAWQRSRTLTIEGLYGFEDSQSDGVDGLRTPMTNHRLNGSFTYARRLSPTRNMSFTLGGGATHVTTLNAADQTDLTYWTPSGTASFGIDLGRSWAIAASYTRDASMLQGVSLTSFASNEANVNANGLIGSRVEASVAATYSKGRAGGGTTGEYENYNGSMQLRYAFSRCCAASVIYDYYAYEFLEVADLPSDFRSNFDRQAIRVGFTLWLPLYGRYADGGPARSSR